MLEKQEICKRAKEEEPPPLEGVEISVDEAREILTRSVAVLRVCVGQVLSKRSRCSVGTHTQHTNTLLRWGEESEAVRPEADWLFVAPQSETRRQFYLQPKPNPKPTRLTNSNLTANKARMLMVTTPARTKHTLTSVTASPEVPGTFSDRKR